MAKQLDKTSLLGYHVHLCPGEARFQADSFSFFHFFWFFEWFFFVCVCKCFRLH